MVAERLNGALLVLGVQAARPALQHVRELLHGFESQQAAELQRPPEGIIGIDRVAGDHLHVPQAVIEHLAREFEAGHDLVEFGLAQRLVVDVTQ
nr:hypothetical protein [Salinicola tamaricis]